MRILVVDDHAMVREALNLGLTHFGHDVTEAGDGVAALAVMRGGVPDVLVTDLDMPGMGGGALIEEARRVYPALAIVAMSGREVGAEDALSALACLAQECKIEKPFSTEQLIGVINSARARLT